MDRRQGTKGAHLCLLFVCIILTSLLLHGCSHLYEGSATIKEAGDLFGRGNYQASLGKYRQAIEKHPDAADRALFEMGMVYAYPSNMQKDYRKALECFQTVLRDYPGSAYRQASAEMISRINDVLIKDTKIGTQRTEIAALEQEVKNKDNEIAALKKKVAALERELNSRTFTGPAARVLIEKKERRLTLISKDKSFKIYKIALGGNPVGPKERKGDHKTPEGLYTIDARNMDSLYHLSLHVSYPNENDKRRARELGVSPGGSIMIHGLKKGFSWVGDQHTEVDWTRGCIAVTDEEIEEIARLVPNGTTVEIRP